MAYSTINKSSLHFNTLLYSGNSSARSLTGVGFAPSFVWIKERTSTSDHMLFDQPRGVQKYISSNLNNAEATSAAMLTAFDSDGFSLGTGNDINDNGQTYVSWNWKGNGAGSSNSDGSVTSTVSANTTSGFSIVKFDPTGAACTIGHGLGVAPKVIIAKALNRTFSWVWGGDAIGWNKYLELNETQAEATSTARWNDTAPTSTVFSVKNEYNNGDNAIAYCFAEKKGFSKFGLYEGNGNADGAFVYTGFKPAWVMIKAKGQTESWYILDTKRPGRNNNNYYLIANNNGADGTSTSLAMSILSNGFKINNSDTSMNSSGQGYVYMAFAEAPLVGSNNVPCTAR